MLFRKLFQRGGDHVTGGEAVRQVFGDEVVGKYASAAVAEAMRHIQANDFLAAAFSAAHAVRLTARTAWTDGDQERMAAELANEVALGLQAGHDTEAAERAASLQMLTGEAPWSDEEAERMRTAVGQVSGSRHIYASVSVADRLADYLVLGGQMFWTEEEFREMRTAVINDYEACLERGDEVLAADRLAIFDVIESSFEAETRAVT